MRFPRIALLFVSLCACLATLALPTRALAEDDSVGPNGGVRVKYWEKWTGFEKDAMQSVVDDFNRSQHRVFIEYLSISGVTQKTLIATAGGNPPDIAGLAAADIVDFADKNALVQLDELARGTDIREERYLPVYWQMGLYKGKQFGLVSAPAVMALHWNKDMFRDAGLDPEKPPATIAELNAFSDKLTTLKNGQIERMGFLPVEPGWWPYGWFYFFDGKLVDGKNITIDSPENVQAFTWIQSYSKQYGTTALQNLTSTFGNMASAQNAFMSRKVAMVFQGVWMGNFIDKYAPDLHWGAAPFPSVAAGGPPVALSDADMLVIPRGAKHAQEAFEFLKFFSAQAETEKLCAGQRKNSPLRELSANFIKDHKNPYIGMFQALAGSPRAVYAPPITVWHQYNNEINEAFSRVWLGEASPRDALADTKRVMQKEWDRELERQAKVDNQEPSSFLSAAPILLIGVMVLVVIALAVREQRRVRAVTGGGKSTRSNASLFKGLAFFSPWGVGMLVFVAFPVMSSVVYSFCDYSVLSTPKFVGLQNFMDLLTDDVFWVALKNTVIYAVFALPLALCVAFVFALLLDSNVRGSGIYRTLIFLPSLTPLVASAMVWLWIFNAQYGVLNYILSKLTFGLVSNIGWLSERKFAMPSLILMSFWGVGQTVVILLASMQDVPTAIYEAADIDGASWWTKVRHITIPLTSPVIYFNGIIGIIGALQVFAVPYIMTGGGPARATLFYAMRLYENAFGFLRMGYACAMAWILFLIILGLTYLAEKLGKSRVHYTEG